MNIAKFRVDIWELSEDLFLNDQVKDQKEAEYLAKVFDRIWRYRNAEWTEKNYRELRKLYNYGKGLMLV
jgi:hypothetical protein